MRAVIRLEVEQGDARGHLFERDAAEITIGRAPTSDLVLPDWHISGSHGALVVNLETGALRFRDNRSTNGSRVRRGTSLLAVDASTQFELELVTGDRLLLGDPEHPVVVRVTYVSSRAASARSRRDGADAAARSRGAARAGHRSRGDAPR